MRYMLMLAQDTPLLNRILSELELSIYLTKWLNQKL
jgi:hypothetical protein